MGRNYYKIHVVEKMGRGTVEWSFVSPFVPQVGHKIEFERDKKYNSFQIQQVYYNLIEQNDTLLVEGITVYVTGG